MSQDRDEPRVAAHGLSVRRYPRWTDVELSPGSRLTLTVIGDRIIHTQPQGTVRTTNFERVMALIDEVVDEVVPAGKTYGLVIDLTGADEIEGGLSSLPNASVGDMMAKPRLAVQIFCGLSPMLALNIRLGRKIHPFPFKLELAETPLEAIRRARELLEEAPTTKGWAPKDALQPLRGMALKILRRAAARLQGSSSSTQPQVRVSPTIREARPDLSLDLGGLSVDFEVIDGDVLNTSSAGHLEAHHVEPLLRRDKEALEELSHQGPVYFLADISKLTGTGRNARRAYIQGISQLVHERPFELMVFYSPNRLMRTVIDLGRRLVPFRVETASDLESALGVIAEHRAQGTLPPESPSAGEPAPSDADALLQFLSDIDWDVEGLAAESPHLAEGHPLKVAFDAISVLKMDVDTLLRGRRRDEEALRQSELLLRTVIDATKEAILSLDADGRIALLNNSAEVLFDWGPSEGGLGALFERSLAPESREQWEALFNTHITALETGGEVVEITGLRADGDPFPLELSLSTAIYSDGRHLIVVGRDLTEQKRHTEERERLEGQLQQGQRMRSLGTLAGGIAHDFNNLLMTIQGNISILLMDATPGTETFAAFKTIEGQLRSGADLTRQLLAYARKGKYEIRPLNLNEVVAQISETFWRTHKGIHVHRELQPGLLAVEADQSQLEQVVLNLGLNAGDAMPEGGDLFLETRALTAEETIEEVPEARAVPHVLLSVRDTGVGMPPETVEHVFEPFFTTKEMGHGTGLGLASVYGSVMGHGGQITVSSSVGQGTIFKVYLPTTDKKVALPAQQKVQVSSEGGTLLLVDDEPLVLRISQRLLQRLGFVVIAARGGQEAIEIYRAARDRIDLVILDMIMPDMNGGETFDRLKAIDPGVKVLLSSGYSLEGEARLILERGCVGFIQKPFTVEQIMSLILDVIEPSSPASLL